MEKALIKISYRQVIDASSKTAFEKNVLNASYNEFLMKSQVYNMEGKFKTFTELKTNDGRANSLHYKSSFAVVGFIDALHKKIPGLHDTLGRNLLFETFRFEVIESDISNKSIHSIAITYVTDVLSFAGAITDHLVLAYGDQFGDSTAHPMETFLLKMQENVSIETFQQAATPLSIEY